MTMSAYDWYNANTFDGNAEMARREASGRHLRRMPEILSDEKVLEMIKSAPVLK